MPEKQDTLDAIDAQIAELQTKNHAELNAHPGVNIVEDIVARLTAVRVLVVSITEA